MVKEFKALVSEFKPYLQELKITRDYLNLPAKLSAFEKQEIADAFTWLTDIKNKEFAKFLKIKKLLTPEQWARYELWGDFAEHQEVVLLRDAKVALRAAIVSLERPKLFKKGYVDGKLKSSSHSRKTSSKHEETDDDSHGGLQTDKQDA